MLLGPFPKKMETSKYVAKKMWDLTGENIHHLISAAYKKTTDSRQPLSA
jgi:hypothetical protein